MCADQQTASIQRTGAVVGQCRHCGKPLLRKGDNGRLPEFCDTCCRVAHWRAARKARKAQEVNHETVIA